MTSVEQAIQTLSNFHGMEPAASSDIEAAEAELGLRFSEDYRSYLQAFSLVSANGHELTGLCKSARLNVVDVTFKEREANPGIDQSWYVIERIGIDGAIAWQTCDGAIYRTTSHSSAVKVCDSLVDYISR